MLDFIKKIFTKKQKEALSPEKLSEIKKVFLEILNKYTSISLTLEGVDEGIKNRASGLFSDKYECSVFRVPRGCYAIRFIDNMPAEEFYQVFDLLKNDMGDPDIFSECDGYVWTRQGYIISLGLVRLNLHYEVPMICVYNDISEFSATVDYKEYTLIANSINKPLIERKIKPDRKSIYPIFFGSSFNDRNQPCYISIDNLQNATVYVSYKRNRIELCIIPLVRISELDDVNPKNKRLKQNAANVQNNLSKAYPETDIRVARPQDKFTTYAFVSDISMIEESFNQLLEETKDYYEIK